MSGAPPQGSLTRYHSLDRLRATMMLLGVVRHAAVSYVPTVFFEWPYRDAQADMLAYWVVVFIRVFHLPVFFAVAGFFAAYVAETRGTRGFLRHRWSRIGVPFLVAWPVLAVTMFFIVPFAARFSATPPNAAYSLAELTSPRALDHLFMHLWFLYHLMILCAVATALRPLAVRIPATLRARAMDLFARRVHRGGVAVLILAAGFLLYRMESWAIDYYAGPLPPPRLLALYGLFFGFGWMLFRRRETVEGFKRPAWVFLAAGILCFFVYRHFFEIGCTLVPDRTCGGAGGGNHLRAVVFLAMSMWFMAYGLIGVFQRYMDGSSRPWRYMADASYWIYVVHVPFVMLLPLLLAGTPLPGLIKLALVSVMAIGLILVTYHYFVRPTFIGKQLNGRRYPRGAA
ncbi:MAG: acyltransferase family protein [Gemmatimonadetes bacterium]|nr:acyltransferase family protein [Gemmatimonadota bacterium]